MTIDADDGKALCVVVCLNPPEGYVSRNGDYAGRVQGAHVIPAKNAEPLSKREQALVARTFFALRASLSNIFESASPP